MKKEILILFLGIAFLIGCQGKTSNLPEKETVKVESDKFEKAKVEVKIERLEHEMFQFKSREDVSAFLRKHPLFVKEYLEIPNAANEAPFVNQLFEMYTNPKLKEFYYDNEKFFGDFSDLKAEMNSMFSYVKYYYPDYYVPEINTLVTGFRFDRDFAFSDSLIVIGIDYFVGSKARYRPQFYDYMLARYEKPYMVPMMGLAISSKYDAFDIKDETMIAEMIHFGKAHYFLQRIMPELPDSLNIQYTGQELKEVDKNADVIWSHFIEKKLLFDTNHKIKQRYLGESPKVVTIGDKCPGRIGRWLGWQIVRKYMQENPEVTLQDLMKNKNAQEIFKKSKFKIKMS
ncbi:MAG TPA: gliding motility lipoprotein GldB [Cytophagaceae bacterium]|jgi:gliding motility-associated lipoprotein GldB|nr:gliding motility lipoprotein GldB [Cytophagaceae bacterium]